MRLKIFTLLIALWICSISTFAQQKNNTFEFVKTEGSHTAKVVFKVKPFAHSKHKLTYSKQLDITVLKVDGRMALGVDGNAPKIEIQSLHFYFDGKKVFIPRRLYSDCFEPNFDSDYFQLKIGDDGKSLLAFMAGSDGAGSYQVYWVLRKDGKHSRFSKACSDCNYTDFIKGFFDKI